MIIAIVSVVVLSLSFASAVFARAMVMSSALDDCSRKSKCATEITSGTEVLKCMPGGGCQWAAGSAVTYGGKC